MLLTAEKLTKEYIIEKSLFSFNPMRIKALNQINFHLDERSVLGVVGETGSGKSTLAKLIVKLLTPTSGEINYGFEDIPKSIQMIFQNPFNSLNPRLKIKTILKEPLLIHKLDRGNNKNNKVNRLLEKVNLNSTCLNKYAGEFSGGQRQRIAIARALAVEPKILVCDEPTSSLDLSVQAQILNLFIQLKENHGLSYIFITHNLEVISFIADKVLILYKGMDLEKGDKERIFANPLHPYTKVLLSMDTAIEKGLEKDNIEGCPFRHQCKYSLENCNTMPNEIEVENKHYVKCHLYAK